jgi:type II secretory ATPase GspE/PulE/Tfp pilus assembly ATPase PilB-like protein
MKVEPFLVASTLSVVIAQRLVRQVCQFCKHELVLSIEEVTKNFPEDVIKRNFGDATEIKIFKGQGCKMCRQSGYLGRIGLFEVLEVTKSIRALITRKADSDEISAAARKEGMTTMLDDGLTKVKQGRTTLEEVLRVTKSEFM